jgi:hypothetical protein
MFRLATVQNKSLGLRVFFCPVRNVLVERCFGTLGGLEPIKVSAKGLSGGGVKIRPLSARHGIAEISDLRRECHDPASLGADKR